jgi:hypothetical protein
MDATGGQKPWSWSCFSRPVSSKYLQKKSFGTVSYVQTRVVPSSPWLSSDRPARSTGGHTKVGPGVVVLVLVDDDVDVLVEDEVEEEVVAIVVVVALTHTAAVPREEASGHPERHA